MSSSRTAIESQTFEGAGGLKLAADVGGRAGDPAVILMHGGGQTRHSWGKATRELVARGYYVVNLDARGHGGSEWAADSDGYALPLLAADVERVIAALPGGTVRAGAPVGAPVRRTLPALVGASMGGLTSLQLIGASPTPIASALVLVDVVPRVETAGAERILSFMRASPEGFATIDEAADAVAAYNPHRPRPRDPRGLAKNLRQHADGRWRWHWDPQFVQKSRNDRGYAADQLLELTRRVTVPTLLVRGMHSDIVSERGIDELRGLLPHVEVFDIAEAGHMIAGDKNDAFNHAMIDFLDRHLRSGAAA